MTNEEILTALLGGKIELNTKNYVDGFYYRIKELGDNKYEIGQLAPGYCGETTYAPKIEVEFVNDKVNAINLYDQSTTPVRTMEAGAELDQELTALLGKFAQLFVEDK
jgi:hypothetical protein